MTTSDKDDSRSPGGPLLIAWLLVFAAVAGTVAWLYFYGAQPGAVATVGIPQATAPIPPSPEQAAGEAPPPVTQEAPSGAAAVPENPPAATPPEQQAVAEPPKAEAPPTEAPAPPAKPLEPVEAKSLQAKPPEAASAATKPPEPAAAEAKPAEEKPAKPAEAKPPEPTPHETKAAEAKEPAKPETKKTPEPENPKATAAAPAPTAAPIAPPTATPVEKQVAALPSGAVPHGPDPALIEHGRQGPLPMIGPDGRQPWQTYARPFDDKDKRPRIAVVITDLGLSGAATETAIQQLPGSVTLSFSPYAKGLDQWANLARAAGHEVLLDLPMEPLDYPEQDPGPYTLLTSLDPKQNLFKMQWLLSRATGYVGVTNHMGSRFTTSGPDLKPVLEQIKARGLLFLDSRSSEQSIAAKLAKETGMAWAINSRFIDPTASRDAIDNQLAEIQKIAKKTGYAVAMGSAYPVTIERVAAWIPKAEAAGFAIAPVTAIAGKQPLK